MLLAFRSSVLVSMTVPLHQDLLAGVGGKYCHADSHPDGGTQIGGMRTKSKSMVGADYGTKGEMTGIATALAKGKPPYIQNGKNDFRF